MRYVYLNPRFVTVALWRQAAAVSPMIWLILLPVKPAKLAKPTRQAIAFVAVNSGGEVFLQTRPEQGLFGGMLGFPNRG